ncbi:transposase [Streptomyces sp. NPDC001250]|uniref:transposase n=1 Tax=unclassified Streptomyces TaxID=2593676 RepID=UPI00332BF813
MSDEAWELILPVITAGKARHPSASGHDGQHAMREIVNRLLHRTRTGCPRRDLPHGQPPKSAVYYCFATWRDDGTAETILVTTSAPSLWRALGTLVRSSRPKIGRVAVLPHLWRKLYARCYCDDQDQARPTR